MKNRITIRMGAPNWDVTVNHNGTPIVFDYRKMDKKARSTFHREFMNAYRAGRAAA